MERETLSAHELNKYAYCPYQWYYERLYGRKELRRLYRERNERLGLENSTVSNFQKGEKYHQSRYRSLKWRRFCRKLLSALFALAVAVGYLWLRYGMA